MDEAGNRRDGSDRTALRWPFLVLGLLICPIAGAYFIWSGHPVGGGICLLASAFQVLELVLGNRDRRSSAA